MENKCCFVPGCKTTSKNAPKKVFVTVPRQKQRRANWFKSTGREAPNTTTMYYCCEDHFNFEEDMVSYMRYKFMGGSILLKQQVVPHIFDCSDRKRTESILDPLTRKKIIEEILSKKDEASDVAPGAHLPSLTESSAHGTQGVTYLTKDPTSLNTNHVENNGAVEPNVLKQNEHTQLNQPNIPENNRIRIPRTMVGTSWVLENEIKEMRFEISSLQKSILKTKNEYLTSERKLKKIKNIILMKQQNTKASLDEGLSNKMIRNLKMRFALGKSGYTTLRSIYPLPPCTTLWNMICNTTIEFGLSSVLIPVLQARFSVMEKWETDCILCISEMEIAILPSYNSKRNKHYGNVTLGDIDQPGSRLMFILLRGLNSDWRQIVSMDVTTDTPKGDDILERINGVIEIARNAKLNIRGIVSDMGTNSEAMWTRLGLQVSSQCQKTFFEVEDSKIHVIADFQLLLKYLAAALLNESFTLNQTIADSENLPSCVINGSHVRELQQIYPICLTHLRSDDVFPKQFEKANVAAAIRFFSIETAKGLENAIRMNVIENHEILTTAWFIRLIHKWFLIVTASRFSITKENVEETVKFLEYFISIIQSLEIGVKGWERLGTSLILSTTSFINLAQEAFEEEYSVLLGSRLTLNILEHDMWELKKRLNYPISAMKCLRVMKSIILSQLMLK